MKILALIAVGAFLLGYSFIKNLVDEEVTETKKPQEVVQEEIQEKPQEVEQEEIHKKPPKKIEEEIQKKPQEKIEEKIVEEPVEVIKEKLVSPVMLAATDGDFTDKINISWRRVEGAERYYLYRSSIPDNEFGMIGETTDTHFDDETAIPNEEFFYRIKAWSIAAGYSDFSEQERGFSSHINLGQITDFFYKIDSLKTGETKWYRFEAKQDTIFSISWEDKDSYFGSGKFNADIRVSAYREDKKTAYFVTREYPKEFVSKTTEQIYIKIEADRRWSKGEGDFLLVVAQRETGNYTYVMEWGGNGTDEGRFREPYGIALFSDRSGLKIYVADVLNNRVQQFLSDGKFYGLVGPIISPQGLAIDQRGFLYAVEQGENVIRKIGFDEDLSTHFPSTSVEGQGRLQSPVGVAISGSGKWLYVTDTGSHQVKKFDTEGNYVLSWGGEGTDLGKFRHPSGIVTTTAEPSFVYVVDTSNNRVQKFTEDGIFVRAWGTKGSENGQFLQPAGIALDSNWDVYVVDSGNNRIQKFNELGHYITSIGEKGSGKGQFNDPRGIAVDEKGCIYIVDTKNNRIQKMCN
jgi:hypothetical protein